MFSGIVNTNDVSVVGTTSVFRWLIHSSSCNYNIQIIWGTVTTAVSNSNLRIKLGGGVQRTPENSCVLSITENGQYPKLMWCNESTYLQTHRGSCNNFQWELSVGGSSHGLFNSRYLA
jgi:hypothetical protein